MGKERLAGPDCRTGLPMLHHVDQSPSLHPNRSADQTRCTGKSHRGPSPFMNTQLLSIHPYHAHPLFFAPRTSFLHLSSLSIHPICSLPFGLTSLMSDLVIIKYSSLIRKILQYLTGISRLPQPASECTSHRLPCFPHPAQPVTCFLLHHAM